MCSAMNKILINQRAAFFVVRIPRPKQRPATTATSKEIFPGR